ncbi:MAG: dipeptidase PepE [Bacteroidales bacterium]
MKLLLLSNSTMKGEEYLRYPMPMISNFLGKESLKGAFIPYAGVTISYDDYESKVKLRFSELGHQIESVHKSDSPIDAVNNADFIVVGGGNSFMLLHQLYETDLLRVIKNKVAEGIPYIGWSAGSNMACPSIKTTNDMPIVYPVSFDALSLISFQINPHYTEKTIEGHGGESRLDRLSEFIVANPEVKVACLEEGCAIEVCNEDIKYFGKKDLLILSANNNKTYIKANSLFPDGLGL